MACAGRRNQEQDAHNCKAKPDQVRYGAARNIATHAFREYRCDQLDNYRKRNEPDQEQQNPDWMSSVAHGAQRDRGPANANSTRLPASTPDRSLGFL